MEPQEPATQPIPLTLHVTAVFEVPVTFAEKCCCPPVASTTSFGETLTETVAGEPILTVALVLTVTSASDIAVTVTVAGEGAVGGAV